ncbi:MAG: hypothetical protein ACOC38_11075 [Promethearchaeia archaeon]
MKIEYMDFITIPIGLAVDEVKKALRGGHAYEFTLLVESPRRTEVGVSRKEGLPELLVLGRKLAVASESSSLVKQMLTALQELNSGGETPD